jgi:hypothetical protein
MMAATRLSTCTSVEEILQGSGDNGTGHWISGARAECRGRRMTYSHEIIYVAKGAVFRTGRILTLNPSQGTVGNLGVAHFERISNGFRMVSCYRSIPVLAVLP